MLAEVLAKSIKGMAARAGSPKDGSEAHARKMELGIHHTARSWLKCWQSEKTAGLN